MAMGLLGSSSLVIVSCSRMPFSPRPITPECQTCDVIVGCFTGYLEFLVRLQLVR